MSAKSAESRNWQEVNAEQIQQELEKDEFIHKTTCGCSHPLFTFRFPGESIEGYLEDCTHQERFDRSRAAHLEFIRDATGQWRKISFRLNKALARTIDKNHLWGRYIKITYKGSVRRKHLHFAEKIYLVEVDKGCITPKYERIENEQPKQTSSRKPKPIKRPGRAGSRTAAVAS